MAIEVISQDDWPSPTWASIRTIVKVPEWTESLSEGENPVYSWSGAIKYIGPFRGHPTYPVPESPITYEESDAKDYTQPVVQQWYAHVEQGLDLYLHGTDFQDYGAYSGDAYVLGYAYDYAWFQAPSPKPPTPIKAWCLLNVDQYHVEKDLKGATVYSKRWSYENPTAAPVSCPTIQVTHLSVDNEQDVANPTAYGDLITSGVQIQGSSLNSTYTEYVFITKIELP